MIWILGIIIGGAVGYIARFMLPTRQDSISAVITGATGSLLGIWFFADVLNMDPISSFGTLSLLSTFFGIVGSVFLIVLTEITLEPIQKSMKKYETETEPLPLRITHVVPVYTHQYEYVKVRTKKRTKTKKLV